ncbi:hypothetical protein FLONG3_4896 [Fusarium longipes]|uniref:Uncharacterized protein n=1 Tax=Fusarium longipes TaxID=694270 RepID=A0A395SWU0_9HYPO|nr:hypothetical protein FLONG3_4896 [Fusarium longipes]
MVITRQLIYFTNLLFISFVNTLIQFLDPYLDTTFIMPESQAQDQDTVQQSTSLSPQMQRFLQEDRKEMPWHLPSSFSGSSTQTASNASPYTPSENPATKGSSK